MVYSSRLALHTCVGLTAFVVLLFAVNESDGSSHENLIVRKPRTFPMLRLKGGNAQTLRMTRSASQQDLSKPGVDRPGPADKDARKQKIWELSKGYKAADKESIQRFVLDFMRVLLSCTQWTVQQVYCSSCRAHSCL
jgi:hypothetical protein